MIKPTVGRVVLVHRGPGQPAVPALICDVHSDTCITVGGFDQYGASFSETSVELLQDEVPPGHGRYAKWMPFQKGQAAKTEELEAKLGAASA